MPGRLKRDKMVEKHKEENEELKTERGTERRETRSRDMGETDRRREKLKEDRKTGRAIEREREAALLLFQTMKRNVAKDSHIVQQDTVQYIGFKTDTACSQMDWKCGQEWIKGSKKVLWHLQSDHWTH